MLWKMTARASLETPRNGRAGIPATRGPEVVGRGVDEVHAGDRRRVVVGAGP